jgi:hypothetical protein
MGERKLGSELLQKLTNLDSQAEQIVAEARAAAEKTASGLADKETELEANAQKQLSVEVEQRAAELNSEREKLLADIEAKKQAELEAIKAVPGEGVTRAAQTVAERLTEE